MKRVVIAQRRMTQYRVPFFNALRRELREEGVELIVCYGEPTEEEAKKKDSASLEWGRKLATTYLADGRLCYQPLGANVEGCDLLVVTHENKLLCNLWHQYWPTRYRVALWGHGANLQGDLGSWREKFKKVTAARADWWFGYTELSMSLIVRTGFPTSRISIVDNAVDTDEMRAAYLSVSPERKEQLRAQFSLGRNVAIFVGSIYAEKRIEFMLEAAKLVRSLVPNFQLIIVGSGPQQYLVQNFSATHPWVKYIGPRTGLAKVELMALCRLMFNPGLVGLGVLDSFVCGVPLVTTSCNLHSPEIAYLTNGVNGVVTENTLENYANSVSVLLNSQSLQEKLKYGCEVSAGRYTIQNMSIKFAEGVIGCLTAPRLSGA